MTDLNLKGLYEKIVTNADDHQKNIYRLHTKEYIVKWHTDYTNKVKEVDKVRQRLNSKSEKLSAENDKKFLEGLIYEPVNGISSKGNSRLSKSKFDNLIRDENFLNKLTDFIKTSEKGLHESGKGLHESEEGLQRLGEGLQNLRDSWEKAIRQGNPLRINRIASACTLYVSSVDDHKKFSYLLQNLIKTGIIKKSEVDIEGKGGKFRYNGYHWFRYNLILIKEIRTIFEEELKNKELSGQEFDEIYLNQFVWYLYEYFEKRYSFYDLDSISEDGCFIERSTLKQIFDRLRELNERG